MEKKKKKMVFVFCALRLFLNVPKYAFKYQRSNLTPSGSNGGLNPTWVFMPPHPPPRPSPSWVIGLNIHTLYCELSYFYELTYFFGLKSTTIFIYKWPNFLKLSVYKIQFLNALKPIYNLQWFIIVVSAVKTRQNLQSTKSPPPSQLMIIKCIQM